MADRNRDQNVDSSSSDRSGARGKPDSSSSDSSQSDFGANRGGSSSGKIGDRSDNLTGRTDRVDQNDEDIGSSATKNPLQDRSGGMSGSSSDDSGVGASGSRNSGIGNSGTRSPSTDRDQSGGMRGSGGSSSDESNRR